MASLWKSLSSSIPLRSTLFLREKNGSSYHNTIHIYKLQWSFTHSFKFIWPAIYIIWEVFTRFSDGRTDEQTVSPPGSVTVPNGTLSFVYHADIVINFQILPSNLNYKVSKVIEMRYSTMLNYQFRGQKGVGVSRVNLIHELKYVFISCLIFINVILICIIFLVL
jgi:hypothetical protein